MTAGVAPTTGRVAAQTIGAAAGSLPGKTDHQKEYFIGTTTAILFCGKGHPYDGGLCELDSAFRLIEGNRAAWAQFLSGGWNHAQAKRTAVFLADPGQLLLNGLCLCAGETWEGVSPPRKPQQAVEWAQALRGRRLVLPILEGSSLQAEACRAAFQEWQIDAEVLAVASRSPRERSKLCDIRLS